MPGSYSLRRIIDTVDRLIRDYESRDPDKLCRRLGITVYERADFQDLKGMYAKVLDRPCIFLKADLDRPTHRLILAHELGHHLLHADLLPNLALLQDQTFFDLTSQPEREANLFAAELLLEDGEVLEGAGQGFSLEQMAHGLGLPAELFSLKALLLREKGFPVLTPEPGRRNFLRDV